MRVIPKVAICSWLMVEAQMVIADPHTWDIGPPDGPHILPPSDAGNGGYAAFPLFLLAGWGVLYAIFRPAFNPSRERLNDLEEECARRLAAEGEVDTKLLRTMFDERATFLKRQEDRRVQAGTLAFGLSLAVLIGIAMMSH